jgi:uncharacterized protein (TIRG00374 family)
MKRWYFWIGLLISAFFLLLALRGLHLPQVWQTIRSANFIWLLPATLVYFVAVLVRTWRWHFLLRPIHKLPIRLLFPIIAVGYMGNNIYPARAGELVRAFILKRKTGIPAASTLATIVVERLFDGVVMLSFIFFNISALARLVTPSGFIGGIQSLTFWGAIGFFGFLAVFLSIALFPTGAGQIFGKIVNVLTPRRWRGTVNSIFNRFLTGLKSLRSIKEMILVLLTSFLIWLLETAVYWLVSQAFAMDIHFSPLMLMNGILNLLTTLPSAPGYIGVFDAPGIALLRVYGFNSSIAAGFTLLLHATLWLPITLVGGFFFAKEGINWTQAIEKGITDKEVHER